MKRILIIKTSSLGDLIHTFPALTATGKVLPNIRFDWVVEEAFQEIPAMHPLVDKVIPVAIRRWRKHPLRTLFSKEFRKFRKTLRSTQYDLIIDAQGLIKSAIITKIARGPKAGLDKNSLTEPFARFFYHRQFAVNPKKHAIFRMQTLFAKALGYTPPTEINLHEPIHYGITPPTEKSEIQKPYLLFLHGTTWHSKHWPDEHWVTLAKLLSHITIALPWSNEREKKRTHLIAKAGDHMTILPKMSLTHLSTIIAHADCCITVDSGLAHLAAALNTPTITLYGPTDPQHIGTAGAKQTHLQPTTKCTCCRKKECPYMPFSSQCLSSITPPKVAKLLDGMTKRK